MLLVSVSEKLRKMVNDNIQLACMRIEQFGWKGSVVAHCTSDLLLKKKKKRKVT